MIFSEARFFGFMALVYVVHWHLLRRNTARKWWLLLVSYIFYAAWDWRFLGLILASTAIDYMIGVEIPRGRLSPRLLVSASIFANLSILGFFKYFEFFVASLVELMAVAGVAMPQPALEIVLPVGISFYTFQTMSYTIDVYRGQLQPVRRPLDLALFVAFFPQLVAGPIVRAADMLPQLRSDRVLSRVAGHRLLILFLLGFVKKAVVSDNIAPVIDAVYAAPMAYESLAVRTVVVLYALQIYCDFSGYSDMAIATAGLLGFELPQNFNLPYFSSSVAAFWRRWHISLSTWLRDYLYIPLGGGRGGRLRTARNLFVTMFLGGLWHGASWTFVFWGLLHGVALAVHRLVVARGPVLESRARTIVAAVGATTTFAFVGLAWVFFRAPNFATAWEVLLSVFGAAAGGVREVPTAWLVSAAVLPAEWIVLRSAWTGIRTPGSSKPWIFALVYGVTWALVLTAVPRSARPFIYFQF